MKLRQIIKEMKTYSISDYFEADANNLPIEHLTGMNIETKILSCYGCIRLKDATGILSNINRLYLEGCPSFEQDPLTIKNIKKILVDLPTCPKIPIIRAILTPDPIVRVEFFPDLDYDKEYSNIMAYRGKGLREVVNLIRVLNDAGFSGNAKL